MTSGTDVDNLRAAPPDGRPVLGRVVIGLAFWNGVTTCLVLAVALLCGKPVLRALLLMVSGVSVIWIYIGGAIMYAVRNPVRDRVRSLHFDWRITFVLFCTFLALLEEAVTTTMTNCAALFGVPIGRAYITASTNYLDVVCLHSVVVFVPMFIGWAWILSRWNFSPEAVLLLFGITGTLAEVAFSGPQSIPMFGFWIFVYGLMVYLPAYCLPEGRHARSPRALQILLAPVIPMVFAIPVAIVISRIHPVRAHFPPMIIEPRPSRVPAAPLHTAFQTRMRVTSRGYTLTPEPGAFALLGGLGLTGAAMLRRRRAR